MARTQVAEVSSPGRELTRGQLIWTGVVLWLCFLVVGGSAGFSSFRHIVHVSLLAHQDQWVSYAMPLSIDGSMVIATVAMYRDRVTGRHPRGWARFTLWFGLALSMYANVASYVAVWGWQVGWLIWAGLPPVLLMLSIEVMAKPGRIRAAQEFIITRVEQAHTAAAELTGKTKDPAAPPPVTPVEAPVSPAVVAVPRPAPGRFRQLRPDEEPLPADLVALAVEIGTAWRDTNGAEITRAQLRDQIKARTGRGLSNTTAGRLLDLIRNGTNNHDPADDQASDDQASDDQGDGDQGDELAAVAAANGHQQ